MLRWLSSLFIFVIIASLCIWLVKHDGAIMVEWLGYHIQTSTSFMVLATAIVLALLLTIFWLLIWIIQIPTRYRQARFASTHAKGLNAITQGFAAIAAGDSKQARRLAHKATACLGTIPLTHILTAQTAQLSGDRALAETHYTAMLNNPETHIIALRGLLVHAKQDGDIDKAIALAEQAASLKGQVPWATSLLLQLYPQAEKWEAALQTIRLAAKQKLITPSQSNRMLGIIALAKSQIATQQQDVTQAMENAKQAYKLLPDFVPSVVHYATLLGQSDHTAKALKLLETIWQDTPHPDVIQTYLSLIYDEKPEEKFARIERLALIHPDALSGHVAAAQAALNMTHYGKARDHLQAALAIAETPQVCRLMVDLERLKQANTATIDQWQERAKNAHDPDSCWQCRQCSLTSLQWHSNCFRCHGFDTLVFDQDAQRFAPGASHLIDTTVL